MRGCWTRTCGSGGTRSMPLFMRPWPVGLPWRQGNALARGLAQRVEAEMEGLLLGINGPYEVEDISDYTIPVHVEARGLPRVLIEVQKELLRDATGVARMAAIFSDAYLGLELE